MADLNIIKPAQVQTMINKFCCTIGMLPTSYKASITYEEQILAIGHYLETVVYPAINQNAEALEELQGLFIALKDYVDNYFDNLDVQEEINNKLDAMVEDGTLAEIINQEIFGEIQQSITDLDHKIDNEINDVETTIGDIEDLSTNDKTSIVNAINNQNSSQFLNLGKSITYDIASNEDVGHVQGACSNENMLYVAVQGGTNYPTGYIYVFNIVTSQYVTRYEVQNLYHGNDLTYLDGKIYIAQVDSNKITEYNPSTGESVELNPFSDYSSYVISGISQLNGKLVAWLNLSTNADTDFSSDKIVMINNLSDLTDITEMTLNDPFNVAKVLNGYIVRQQFDIDEDNNTVYFLNIQPMVLIEGTIKDNEIKLQKMYELPLFDSSENSTGEIEAVSVVKNSQFSKGSLFLTSRQFKTYFNTTNQYGKDTIQNYIVNPKVCTTRYISSSSGYHNEQLNHFNYISVNKTSTSLIEEGSTTKPYKDLIRAMNAVKAQKGGPIIVIRDSSTYYLPYLFNYKDIKISIPNGVTPTIYFEDLNNCNISIETEGTGKVIIKPINSNKRITFKQCDINLLGASGGAIEFNECQVQLSNARLNARRCKINNTEHVSSSYGVQMFDASYLVDDINYILYTGDKNCYIAGNSVIVTSQYNASIYDKSGAAAIINSSI